MITPIKISPVARRSSGVTTQEVCQYSFDGSTEYLEFGDIMDDFITDASPIFTIEAWVKLDDIGIGRRIISKTDTSGTYSWWLQRNSLNVFQFVKSNNGTSTQGVSTNGTYTDISQYYHVVVVFDYTRVGTFGDFRDTIIMYVNGVKVASTASTSTKTAIYNSAAPVRIGKFFNGDMRMVAIYDVAKTSSEVLAMYNNGNIATPINPQFYVNFKTDTFATNWAIKDLSGNDYNGVSVGMDETNKTCSEIDLYSNVINDGNFSNSITYSTNKRSTSSEFEFNYSGELIQLKAIVDGVSSILVYIDGVYDRELTMVDNIPQWVTFTAGAKVIKLVEDTVGTIALVGCRLSEINLERTKYSKINQGTVADRFVFLGDSITQGFGATIRASEGYASLFKFMDGVDATILGYGAATLNELWAVNGSTTLQWIDDAFQNTTGRKVLTIMLTTNDYANGTLASLVNTYYSAFIDAINAQDSDIEIFCITPTIRTDDGALLDTYRANIVTMCSSRAFATSIDGKTILTVGELADTVHPNTAGHLLIHDAIDGIIL